MTEIKNLTKKYGGKTALDGLSFALTDNRVNGLFGPSGAGKSTVTDILAGCTKKTSGSVVVCDADIDTEPLRAGRKVGYLSQITPIYPDMTPYEYLVFIAEAKKVSYDKLYRQVDEALELTGADGVKSRPMKKLPLSSHRRIGIAQALLGSPELIILDEPTAGLDSGDVNEINSLIRMLGGMKTLLVTGKQFGDIIKISDELIVISDGKLVARDTSENINARLMESGLLRISVRGDADTVLPLLTKLDGVTRISVMSSDEGVLELRISHKRTTEIRDAVFGVLSQINCPILSMENETPQPEDIFSFPKSPDAVQTSDEKAPQDRQKKSRVLRDRRSAGREDKRK